jgi:flagellar biosynthesis/type III secretory pathway protein FliH
VTSEEFKQQLIAEGIELGKQEAREAAVAAAEEKFSHSVKLFTSAINELQHLKGELISTGREIFAEIAQICAEKVLRTTVKISDDALRKIYESATSQFSLDSKLQIEMHPDDLARLEPHLTQGEKDRIRLVANDKITQGDLKIEANNEVISLDLHSTVQQIIDALKDDLFENVKKDDSTDKAG